MEKQRVIRLGVFYQPMHCTQDVRLRRLTHGVLLIVGQDDHVLTLVAKMSVEICRHILHIVDTAPQLSPLTKVVDADKKSLSPAIASRVLERVATGRAVAEILCS